jgi:oxygen-independent coproporphyrinogen-3 oxidase
MCQGCIDVAALERSHGIDFNAYFREALEKLRPHMADGLVCCEPKRITVTSAGRLLLRSIAMCFDAYLDAPRAASDSPSYSKVV